MMGQGRQMAQSAHEFLGTWVEEFQRLLSASSLASASTHRIQILQEKKTQKMMTYHPSKIKTGSLWTTRRFSREVHPKWVKACEGLLLTIK